MAMPSVFNDPAVQHRCLCLVADGASDNAIAKAVGSSPKSLRRAIERDPEFGAACGLVRELGAATDDVSARALRVLLNRWRPPQPPPADLEAAEPAPVAAKTEPVVVDVEVVSGPPKNPEPTEVPGPKPRGRRPDPEPGHLPPGPLARLPLIELVKLEIPSDDEIAAFCWQTVRNPNESDGMRRAALAALTLDRQSRGRKAGELHQSIEAEARAGVRGRDPGVPASVWQEARRNFLGPAPAPADDSKGADVVELEQATPS